ncbi:MAG: tail fiber protein [Alphaproteobacteria bacterium]|nr:tail fiber protein [Alphaproteobacteria bacterium]
MKVPKISTLMNSIDLFKKINDLIDVARMPLKRSTAYVVGDVVHVYSLPSNLYLECIQAGTTSFYLLNLSTTVGAELTDGTAKWIVRDMNDRVLSMQGVANAEKIMTVDENGKVVPMDPPQGVPIGIPLWFAGNGDLPENTLLCDGSQLDRTDYAILFGVIGTSFGSGNGSTTFNLPNLIDKFIEGSNVAGTIKDAGLPDIVSTQAFMISGGGSVTGWSGSGLRQSAITFKASNYNSIYGNSDTVQPPAVTMRPIIRYQ